MENYKINREKKSFVLDSGEEIPIPKDKVTQVLRSRAAHQSKKEAVEKWQEFSGGKSEVIPAGEAGHSFINNLSESTFGNLGDTAANYAVSGYKALSEGEGQEGLGYIDRLLDHFYAMQEGRKEHLAGQTEKSPNAAIAGQVAGMGLELGALHGMSATKALPIMGAGHSETSFLEPWEKAKEVGSEALVGNLIDRFFGGAATIAGHRQTRRMAQDAIGRTEAANLAEIERSGLANTAERGRFASETSAREAEVGRLPGLQQAENEAFVNSSAQRVNRVAETLGDTAISKEAMGVEPFISDILDTSINAGSKEGNRITKFLRSIFKGDAEGRISGPAIQRGMQTVDQLIAKEGGTVGEILSEFRNYVTKELPAKLGNYVAFERWAPQIQNRLLQRVEPELASAFGNSKLVNKIMENKMGRGFIQDLNSSIRTDINAVFQKHSGNFPQALADGTIASEIRAVVEANPTYRSMLDNLSGFEFIPHKTSKGFQGVSTSPIEPPKGFHQIKQSVQELPDQIANRFTSLTEKYLPDINLEAATKSGVAENSLQKLPAGPNIVPQPPQVRPAQIGQPNLAPVPEIPEPQGIMQRLAYGLEGMQQGGARELAQGAMNNAPAGILAKMAGVPVGKMVAGGAAIATGLSALTSPSVWGVAARNGLEQTTRMLSAVQQRAGEYPSHSGNGVLQDPRERRSLVREIEDDLNMKIEDKAIIQSKINRGQALIPDANNNAQQSERQVKGY